MDENLPVSYDILVRHVCNRHPRTFAHEPYKIQLSASFKKEAKWFKKHYASFTDDFEELINKLEATPNLGTDLGNGLRKIRMRITSKGKGKSGGARVITFTVVAAVDETEVNLLYIYDKTERASIKQSELEELLRRNGLL